MTRRGALIGTMLLAAGELMTAEQQRYLAVEKAGKSTNAMLSFDFTNKRWDKALEIRLPGQTLTFTAEELARELAGDAIPPFKSTLTVEGVIKK